MRWGIELSRPTVEALRRLDRDVQREVAARIDDVARNGPPPGADLSAPIQIPAADQRLTCVVDGEAHRVIVVTLSPTKTSRMGVVSTLAWRRLRTALGGWGMETLRRELAYAVRKLVRAPGFTTAAVFTLALGVGATSAMFSVTKGVLLSPLPYHDADGIVSVWSSWSEFPKTWVSEDEFLNYRQNNRTLEDLALYFTSAHNLTSSVDPERVGSGVVTPNLFSVLGVTPVIGRTFTEQEAVTSAMVLMLGHTLWQRRYHGDPTIVGQEILVNGQSRTVIGVLPEDFVLPIDFATASPSEVFFAMETDIDEVRPVPQNGGSHGYYSVGRLRSGTTVGEARRDIVSLAERLEADGTYPQTRGFRPLVLGVKDDVVGSAKGTILILLGACGFVLLIACGNVANLLLSRAEARKQDVAVLTALGATRSRIARQLLVETSLLAGLGGLLGWGLAHVGVDVFLALNPEAVPRSGSIVVDGKVGAFTILLTALTAILFGWVPALQLRRPGAGDLTRGSNRHSASNRTQRMLVASQMAMAVILLTGAGLMMKTFVSLLEVDPGFRADNVLTMRLTAPGVTYPDAAAVNGFYEELSRRIEEVPGVQIAAAARLLPLASQMGDAGVRVEGYVPQDGESTAAEWQWVTPGYLEAMGIPLIRGRTFSDGDGADQATVMVINESLARHYWGDGDPIGMRIDTFLGDTATVIGVVGDVRHNGIQMAAKDRFYRPQTQVMGTGTTRRMTLTIKTETDPRKLINPIRRIVSGMDPTMPISEVRTMDEVLATSVAQPRFAVAILGGFAALAVLLAVVGIYGVLAYAVTRRTREIGIRMALGADQARVVRSVVRDGLTMAGVGLALGTLGALVLSGYMEGMLYQVGTRDPVTFLAIPPLFGVVALVACWLPAARAARVPPSMALKAE